MHPSLLIIGHLAMRKMGSEPKTNNHGTNHPGLIVSRSPYIGYMKTISAFMLGYRPSGTLNARFNGS